MNVPFTSRVLSASALVSDRPVEVRAISLSVTTAGAAALLYDGRDASSGEFRLHLEATTNITNSFVFPPGFLFPRGLYVTMENNTEYLTVVYRVLRGPELPPQAA